MIKINILYFNSLFYIIGSVFFMIGSLLFYPTFSNNIYIYGVIFFITGSILYTLAVFQNVFFKCNQQLSIYKKIILNLPTILAGFLFIIGSLCFLPNINNYKIGNWCYRFGSFIYLMNSIWNIYKKYKIPSYLFYSIGSTLFIIGGFFFLFSDYMIINKKIGSIFWCIGSVNYLFGSFTTTYLTYENQKLCNINYI